ncbi:MAG: zinc ribbon domain-containing protein [Planctomycetota bacterium]|jgi:predicted  nucleic acid-binding Zn-ribbon protein
MKESVEKLSRLQGMDSQIRRMKMELDEKPKLLAHERQMMDEAKARLAAAEARVLESHKAADRKDLEIGTRKENILKLEGQLNTATSNKVYSDLLLSIRGHKADIEKIEEDILILMDETEALEADVERVRMEVRNAEEEFNEAEKRMKAECDVVQGDLDKKQGVRDLLASEVDAEALDIYDKVRGSRAGIGITGLEVDREGTHFCKACQMNVNLQDVNVALRGKTIVQCRSCDRILFVESLPTQA